MSSSASVSANTNPNSSIHSTDSSNAIGNTKSNMSSVLPPVRKPAAHNHVSECLFEYLLSEILHWIEAETEFKANAKDTNTNGKDSDKQHSNNNDHPSVDNSSNNKDISDQVILSAERAAAKIERLGFGVGYRLCERLAQFKPIATTHTQPSYLSSEATAAVIAAGGGGGVGGAKNAASHHLEAVKFLCKEFWTEIFRKQVDKLQTNHRGIFVLKDHELRWLKRFPADDERARVAAIKMLAFPCGLIRGALSNLGISAVVSCDFLADGKTMSACSFNIKIKT